ncbi:acyl-CoA synthetase [Frankia sp. QA3]|uniref:acyl-CoA synthetase n=1 Tax=Frankia sp. QA3 TaxID=710111 RepID=UPI000269BA32|nr:acyl-CoA synthetase [Frankia sp. QA3]EIV90646.1 acyl-CoA synthetase (AMP-forming)/AMP-acid ligase II [Frankia sp. QA3]
MTLLFPPLDVDHDAPAVQVGDVVLSRAELLGAAATVAGRVAGAGTVAVHAEASMATVVSIVGCLLAGVPAVPVPPDSGPRERGHILRDSRAELLLGSPDWDDLPIPAVSVDPTRTASSVGTAGGQRRPAPVVSRTSAAGTAVTGSASVSTAGVDGSFGATATPPALILYTSGTTGAPKGVMVPAAAIAADLDALADAWAWTPDDTLVHGLPLFHVHGLVLGVLGALRVGSRLIHTVRPTPTAYAAAGGSLYFGVPTVWSRVCDDTVSARALATARLLVSGSASLPAPILDRLATLTGSAPIERYGMTETLITTSGRADGERRAGWVGPPLRGVRTRLVDDETGAPLPADGQSIGELQVQGPTLFGGYLGRPEVTTASFTADGWFRTGDAAVIAPDGHHRIVGRRSTDLIKSGGYRIGAGEVEAALLAHPEVREAAVVGLPDDDLGQRIAAFVVAPEMTGGGKSSRSAADDLTDFVARELSVHKRPREIHFVAELPRNPMGKVRKSALAPSARQ